MKEMRMTRIVCALVGLLVATTALAEVEESAKTEKVEPAPSTTALETRMEQLENSVAELTSRLRPAHGSRWGQRNQSIRRGDDGDGDGCRIRRAENRRRRVQS